ncbi:MAG: molybdopterin dinucleotide binding domain-containing protein [Candidatus Hermodarchaeota archaeon]|nr:molybdopterin dinucleotide binding domain-containing protein [Candidatus Hermodarchaeota archaeon]
MGLRDFLYPQLEVRLIIARALDADAAQMGTGTLSPEFQELAARIKVAPGDAKRLNLQDGASIEVNSKTGQVVVRVQIEEEQPEGIVVMQPGPWAFAVIDSMQSSQNTKVVIKPSQDAVTSIQELP